MDKRPTFEAIQEAVSKVEHPEIAATLMDLGMLRDLAYDPEENEFRFTLVVPFLGIPQAVRDYMINAVAKAAHDLGVEKFRVGIAQMNEEERQRFFQMEHSLWRGSQPPGA